MAKHKFAIGDAVRMTAAAGRLPTATAFKIVRLVPGDREDLPPAYRVKSVSEGHERVVKEDDIEKD